MKLMSVLIQLVTKIEPLVVPMLFCMGVTAVVVTIMYLSAKNVWVDEQRFRLLGVFFGLDAYDIYRLSLSWVRFLLTVFFVVAFRYLELQTDLRQVIRSPQFCMYTIIGLLYVADYRRPKLILKNLAWFLVISCGLFATSIMSGYMQSLAKPGIGVILIYICMGIFMCLFSLYLFLLEIDEVSRDRKIDPEKEYEESIRSKLNE